MRQEYASSCMNFRRSLFLLYSYCCHIIMYSIYFLLKEQRKLPCSHTGSEIYTILQSVHQLKTYYHSICTTTEAVVNYCVS